MKRRWGALVVCLMLTPASAWGQSFDEIFCTSSTTIVASLGGVVLSSVLITQESNRAPRYQPRKRRRQQRRRKQQKRRKRFLRMMRVEPQAIEYAVMMGQGGVIEDLATLFEVEPGHKREFARVLRAERRALVPLVAGGDAASAAAFTDRIEAAMAANATLRPGYLFRIALLDDDEATPTQGP